MADSRQLHAWLWRLTEDIDAAEDEILREFDAYNSPEHSIDADCHCEPEVFIFEIGIRAYRHRRDS